MRGPGRAAYRRLADYAEGPSDHHELVDEANEQRLILSRPGRRHRLLHNIVSHAMRDEGNLRFAGFGSIIYSFLLFLDQPIEERAENVR